MAKKIQYFSGQIMNEAGTIYLSEIEPRGRYRRAIFLCPICNKTFKSDIADVKSKNKICPVCATRIAREKTRKYYDGQVLNEEIGTSIIKMLSFEDGARKAKIKCGKCNENFIADPYEVIRNTGLCNKCATKKAGEEKRIYKEGDIISKNGRRFLFVKEELKSNKYRRGIFQEIDKNNQVIGKQFSAILYNVIAGTATGDNISRGNEILSRIFQDNNISYVREKSFPDLTGEHQGLLRFDFYLPDYNCCIEYDGEQHYKPVTYFGGKEEFRIRQEHDALKNEYLKKHSIKLIRFNYTQKLTEKLVIDILSGIQQEGRE